MHLAACALDRLTRISGGLYSVLEGFMHFRTLVLGGVPCILQHVFWTG